MFEEMNFEDHYSDMGPDFIIRERMHSSLLALPVYAGVQAGHWTFAIGFRPDYVVYNYVHTITKAIGRNGTKIIEDTVYHNIPIHKFQLGAELRIGYALNERLNTGITYYYGFANILAAKNTLVRSWQTMQLTAGLQYNLRKP
jgi:hypothetical protein